MKSPLFSRAFLCTAALALTLGIAGCSGGVDGSPGADAQGAITAGQAPEQGTIPAGHVSVEAFLPAALQEGVTVIDVRTPEEFATGHLRGAININLESPEFAAEIGKLDKEGTYALYCRSANRSRIAENAMVADGFTSVFGLDGGVSALDPSLLVLD
nr:rhodanese-like domain-containing protein [Actinomycetales bacterium]